MLCGQNNRITVLRARVFVLRFFDFSFLSADNLRIFTGNLAPTVNIVNTADRCGNFFSFFFFSSRRVGTIFIDLTVSKHFWPKYVQRRVSFPTIYRHARISIELNPPAFPTSQQWPTSGVFIDPSALQVLHFDSKQQYRLYYYYCFAVLSYI